MVVTGVTLYSFFYLRLAATAPNQQQGQSNLGDEKPGASSATARLAQSVERKALNLVVVGSSPTVGVYMFRPGVLFFNWLCGEPKRLGGGSGGLG